jgi:hypothetical protein
MIASLKQRVPTPVKVQIRRAVFRARLWITVARIRAVSHGAAPSSGALRPFLAAWGNPGSTVRLPYAEQLCRLALTTAEPILECGSGASTLLLGLMAERTRGTVWSLEQHPGWHAHVSSTLRWLGLGRVRLCHADLESASDYSWYRVPAQLPSGLRVVICDGPPGTTPGGRYGLLPRVRDRLHDDVTILLDDAERPGEQEILRRWQQEFGFSWSMSGVAGDRFAVVRRTTVPRVGHPSESRPAVRLT